MYVLILGFDEEKNTNLKTKYDVLLSEDCSCVKNNDKRYADDLVRHCSEKSMPEENNTNTNTRHAQNKPQILKY